MFKLKLLESGAISTFKFLSDANTATDLNVKKKDSPCIRELKELLLNFRSKIKIKCVDGEHLFKFKFGHSNYFENLSMAGSLKCNRCGYVSAILCINDYKR